MRNLFKTLLLFSFLSHTSCGKDKCADCGTPTSKGLIEVIIDGETYNFKSGFDWGDERNSYINEMITYNEDGIYATFNLNPQPLVDENHNAIYLRLPIKKDFILGSQVDNNPFQFPLLIIEKDGVRYLSTSHRQILQDELNSFPESKLFYRKNFNFKFNEFQRSIEPNVDHINGEISFDMEVLDIAGNPNGIIPVSINFDVKDQNIIGQESPSSGGANSLLGKWYQTPQSCPNSSGERNFLYFKSSSKLTAFQADCNSSCAGGGVTTEINYEISGNQIINTPTSVSEYCGVKAATPAPFNVTYSISSNGILTIDGQQWKK